MRAFKTYVRPILEYACEVVNSYLARDVDTLERVQRDYEPVREDVDTLP